MIFAQEMFSDDLLILLEIFIARETIRTARKGAKMMSNVPSPQTKSPLWKKLIAV